MTPDQILRSWLNSDQVGPEEKLELQSLTELDVQDRFGSRPIRFGTSGIRALMGLGTQRFNRFTYRLLGVSYAHYIKGKHPDPTVMVVHDNRAEGKKWSLEIASALRQEGINVLLAPGTGALSTPILSHLIRSKGLSGAISITASHNPRTYNGLKIFNSIGKQLNSAEEAEFLGCALPLEEAINLKVKVLDKSEFPIVDIRSIEEYIEWLVNFMPRPIPNARDIEVLFASFRGTTTYIMERMAHGLGFFGFREHIQRNHELINPEDPSSFAELIQTAEKKNIQYTMCADLDGDRAAVAERQENGEWYFFNGNEMGAMLAHFKLHFQSPPKPYIVSTHVTNTLINHLFPKVPAFTSETGFKNIAEIVEREEKNGRQLLMAFEEACGVMMNAVHREKDSYQQIAYILTMLAHLRSRNQTLLSYLEQIGSTPLGHWRGLTDYYVVVPDLLGHFECQQLANKLMKGAPFVLQSLHREGKTIVWQLNNHSWIKFRYSGTEPKLKIYYNLFHEDKEMMNGWIKEMQKKFSRLLKTEE